MSLRVLGEVRNVSKTGKIIVRLATTKPPKIGDRIYDEKMREIGYVYDIFGPVSSPLVSIAPTADINLQSLVGRKLYVMMRRGGGRGKRR